MSKNQWTYGWRFLNGAGGTNPNSAAREHYSVLPAPNQKWSDWTSHPNPAQPDGGDCGSGRLHVMNIPSAKYAPAGWYIWYARWKKEDELGRSAEKTGVKRYQLRRVRPAVLCRMIRLGWFANMELDYIVLNSAKLRGANLSGASLAFSLMNGSDMALTNLFEANFQYASLRHCDLNGANLDSARFVGADLSFASFSHATMSDANLSFTRARGAYLYAANLGGANLTNADLSGANLMNANLFDANLTGANFSGANLTGAILPPLSEKFKSANLTNANLTRAVVPGQGGQHGIS